MTCRTASSLVVATAAVSLATGSALAASASLESPDGESVGMVTLTETPNGLIIHGELEALTPGEHGFHVHETGSCSPDFGAAGGHLAPGGSQHGFEVAEGPHPGDLPNIFIADSGSLTFEAFAPALSFEDGDAPLFDDDGAAIVVHADADDYSSQPSGDAGDRIACGVIER